MTVPGDEANRNSNCDVSSYVEVSGDVVQLNLIGTYYIDYTCTRTYGAVTGYAGVTLSTTDVRQVIVQDTTCPTCANADGADSITIEASFPFAAAASAPTCSDNCGFTEPAGSADNRRVCTSTQTKAADIIISNTVDVEQTGTYEVKHSVEDYATSVNDDDACNTAPEILVTVVVIDSLQPVIVLQFGNDAHFTTFHSSKAFSTTNPQKGTAAENSDETTTTTSEALNRNGNPATRAGNPADLWTGWSQPAALMAQMTSVNGWMVAAAAAAVSGVALLAVGKKSSTGLSELV